jgi:group I intron endonuclease
MKNTIILFNINLPNQPVIVYNNAETDRLQILSENKGKAGIYLWTHKETNKMYVGSAVDLSRRLKDYYSSLKLKKWNNYISRALISYTHSAFSLSILEYIDISNLDSKNIRELIFSREQHFFNLLSPVYNIQKIAGSSLGQKRSEATKALISKIKSGENHSLFGKFHKTETKILISEALKGKIHSEETKAKMSIAKIGNKNPNFGKVHSIESKTKMSIARGIAIYVYSKDGLLINNFPSAREAGIFFDTHSKTILRYLKSGKIFKEKWILSSFKK